MVDAGVEPPAPSKSKSRRSKGSASGEDSLKVTYKGSVAFRKLHEKGEMRHLDPFPREGDCVSVQLLMALPPHLQSYSALVKNRFASGVVPKPPEELESQLAGWQEKFSWPLELPAESALLDELAEHVAPDIEGRACAAWEAVTGRGRLLRFLRGFDWSVPLAAAAFRDFLALRERFEMDSVHDEVVEALQGMDGSQSYDRFPGAKSDVVASFFPQVGCGIVEMDDKPGLGPVLYSPMGASEPQAFFDAGHDEAMFTAQHVRQTEAAALRLHELSIARGQQVKIVLVLDFAEMAISKLTHKRFITLHKSANGPLNRTNTEVLGVLFIINLPAFLQPLFRVFEKMAPPKTSAKFRMVRTTRLVHAHYLVHAH